MDAVNMTSGNARAVVKHAGILYFLMLFAAMGVIVFSIVGIAAMMGWMPGALWSGADPAKVQRVAPSKPSAARTTTAPTACRDCGVVESVRTVAAAGREIEQQATKPVQYEIRVRMGDGTFRTLHEATRPALTVGQKVHVTDQGVNATR